jgi:hypothetical protein
MPSSSSFPLIYVKTRISRRSSQALVFGSSFYQSDLQILGRLEQKKVIEPLIEGRRFILGKDQRWFGLLESLCWGPLRHGDLGKIPNKNIEVQMSSCYILDGNREYIKWLEMRSWELASENRRIR